MPGHRLRFLLLVPATACPALAQALWLPEIDLGGPYSDIAASEQKVHWVQGMGAVVYRRSLDSGATWLPPVQLGSARIHLTDVIAADGDDVWVLYLRDLVNFNDGCCPRTAGNIYLRRSTDSGATWLPHAQLTATQHAFRISMAVSGHRVHIVWMEFRPAQMTWDVFYLRSSDRGATWEPKVLLAAGTSGPGNVGAQRPRIAALGDDLHVAWMQKGAGPSAFTPGLDNYDVHYIGSHDGGTTWRAPVRLSPGNAHSLRSNVAAIGTPASPGAVLVSWDDDRPDGGNALRPFARRSLDRGLTWEPEVQVSTVEGDHGTLESNSSSFFLAWHTASAPVSIALTASRDGGATWGPVHFVNGSTTGERTTPLIAATDHTLHVEWLDARTGTLRSWYRRSHDMASCYANCDGSTQSPVLNIADFACFVGRFASGDPYANCDGSGVPPVFNVADFSCFLSKFAAGCP